MDGYNLVSGLGLLVLLVMAWALSRHHRIINIRVIVFGLILQLLIGLFIFQAPAGARVFQAINHGVVQILNSAGEGARFVFGPLALAPGQIDANGNASLGFILAFQGFPTIIFFSALIAILYHLHIMQGILRVFAYVFTRLLHISGAESLATASNIFMGIESALTIKPYLSHMTHSELCTILTAGMATVASNVLALYVFALQDTFPAIAGHLVSASLLSAPAALVMSKILYPETDEPQTRGLHVKPYVEREHSLLEAVIHAAHAGVRMIVGISALLIAVLGLVALLDLFLGTLGHWINPLLGLEGQWSLKGICGYLFYPLVLAIGIPPHDASIVAPIIGERLVVTEVVAYNDLARILSENTLSPRSMVITTYALCGFAHIASMSIFIGGLCALAPERKRAISQVAIRALIAATLACLMTACVAGLFFSENSILLGETA